MSSPQPRPSSLSSLEHCLALVSSGPTSDIILRPSVKTREAREAVEDRERLRARVLQLEAKVEHLERIRALDIYNSLERREGK